MTDVSYLPLRVGVFSIDRSMLDTNIGAVRSALADCVVVRAECMWHSNVIEYTAINPAFHVVPTGRRPYVYTIVWTMHEDGAATHEFVTYENIEGATK